MAVPDFQTFMLPVLREFADGTEHLYKDVRDRVVAILHLNPEDRAERIPSDKKTRVDDRATWAHVYLKQAGLLKSVRRGIYQITPRGQQVLASPPEKITMEFLERFPEYLEFKSRRRLVAGEAHAAATEQPVDHGAQMARTNSLTS
jgi:restriction system protein